MYEPPKSRRRASACPCVEMDADVYDPDSSGSGWMGFPAQCAKSGSFKGSLGTAFDAPNKWICYVGKGDTAKACPGAQYVHCSASHLFGVLPFSC